MTFLLQDVLFSFHICDISSRETSCEIKIQPNSAVFCTFFTKVAVLVSGQFKSNLFGHGNEIHIKIDQKHSNTFRFGVEKRS